ncbi:non-specific lipid-transfer protein-like protein [Iris pallida]|uniref:Non-specific lipid-transfer protein-like protein n=1 Tax=Iris pallida TaxID=29817 RepID=A0AAX6I1P4_IRIPA|nr:non-specific lipid-transfer protein-like protein [Iris pallida]KAJ6796746.1 non-specific lipid-transfer protein-like protein [Iris pallida]KAJ6846900.1 non-specific lipid-transfer protein-like protein [Iris pallida]KAJ6846901.1 non-specific lipid-transfer protein-like protein [Iris pallida]KAJ6854353.1 non-specific lipid-transfer protein-like protein [Iris pallida]
MAHRRAEMCLSLVLMAMVWPQCSWAQPNPNCIPAIASLAPCISFIMGGSSTPPSACCTQLAGVVETQAQCLCTVPNGAPQLPFFVNQTQALTGACNIRTPSVGQCNGASGSAAPAPAATSTETPSATTAPSPSTPTTPSVPSDTTTPATPSAPSVPSAKGGSKSGSTTGASSSASISTKAASLVFFLVAAASVFSSF